MPVEQLVTVLRELLRRPRSLQAGHLRDHGHRRHHARRFCNASETLGAQEIKQTWGTLR
jgi:hypothetical protein